MYTPGIPSTEHCRKLLIEALLYEASIEVVQTLGTLLRLRDRSAWHSICCMDHVPAIAYAAEILPELPLDVVSILTDLHHGTTPVPDSLELDPEVVPSPG
jgi:hypothetical protein